MVAEERNMDIYYLYSLIVSSKGAVVFKALLTTFSDVWNWPFLAVSYVFLFTDMISLDKVPQGVPEGVISLAGVLIISFTVMRQWYSTREKKHESEMKKLENERYKVTTSAMDIENRERLVELRKQELENIEKERRIEKGV